MSPTPQSQHISIADLGSKLEGEVIGPDDAAYDEARQVFFKGVDRRPAAVVRVAGSDDVARVVTFARENGLELAVRSGGHHRAGYGTSEGGIVIDLSGMRALDIDADAKAAWVQTGVTAGEYTSAVGERGRATAWATPAPSGSAGSPSGVESGAVIAAVGGRGLFGPLGTAVADDLTVAPDKPWKHAIGVRAAVTSRRP